MADVRLVDLEVLKRFSLVLRREHAEAEEVLAALEASRLQVLRNLGERVSRGRREEAVPPVASVPPGAAIKADAPDWTAESPPRDWAEPPPIVEPERRRDRPLRAPSRPGPTPGPAPDSGSLPT